MPKYSARNTFGGNSISRQLFDYIRTYLPKGKTILEIGSGWGTSKLIEHWNVWSIESEKEWYKKYHDQYILAPLRHYGIDKSDTWYDIDILGPALKELKYDLLLIDGPYNNRNGFINHLDLFDPSVVMLFDDVRREEGRHIIEEVSKLLERPFSIRGSDRSMFGVISK